MANILIRKLDLPQQEWQSVLKGAGLAILGAAVTYLSQNITSTDFGQYSYIIIPAVTVVLNVIKKVVLHDPNENIMGLSHKDGQPEPEYHPTKEEYSQVTDTNDIGRRTH